MSYTPGPWHATTRQGSWDWLVAHDGRNEICQMFHDGTDLNETGEANARLVAAAPELLEELKSLEDFIETHRKSIYVSDHLGAILNRARNAVAKAEGRLRS